MAKLAHSMLIVSIILLVACTAEQGTVSPDDNKKNASMLSDSQLVEKIKRSPAAMALFYPKPGFYRSMRAALPDGGSSLNLKKSAASFLTTNPLDSFDVKLAPNQVGCMTITNGLALEVRGEFTRDEIVESLDQGEYKMTGTENGLDIFINEEDPGATSKERPANTVVLGRKRMVAVKDGLLITGWVGDLKFWPSANPGQNETAYGINGMKELLAHLPNGDMVSLALYCRFVFYQTAKAKGEKLIDSKGNPMPALWGMSLQIEPPKAARVTNVYFFEETGLAVTAEDLYRKAMKAWPPSATLTRYGNVLVTTDVGPLTTMLKKVKTP